MASNRSHLSVEVLEDRLVLSTFPSLDGLAADVLRFTPLDTPSTQTPVTTNSQTGIGGFGTNFFAPSTSGLSIPGFSGFSNATGQTDPNLFGFGPVDHGIPGLTATAGPANFSQTIGATTGQSTPTTGLTQAQATVLTEFAAARLAAAQLLAVEAAQGASTTPTTTPTTTSTPSAALLAAEVFFAQLQAARFAAAVAQAQAAAAGQTGTGSSLNGLPGTATINLAALQGGNTSAGGGGVFSNNGTAINAFLPAGGFAVFPATGATGAGVFSGIGGGTNAALPANGFPVAGTTQPTLGFTSGPSVFNTGTQTASTSSTSTTSSQGGMNPFNNALAASGFSFV